MSVPPKPWLESYEGIQSYRKTRWHVTGTRPKSAEPTSALSPSGFTVLSHAAARARLGSRDQNCLSPPTLLRVDSPSNSVKKCALSCLRDIVPEEGEEESPRRGHRRTSALSDGSLHNLLS